MSKKSILLSIFVYAMFIIQWRHPQYFPSSKWYTVFSYVSLAIVLLGDVLSIFFPNKNINSDNGTIN